MTLLYLALVLPLKHLFALVWSIIVVINSYLDEILAPLILGEELQLLGIDGTASLFPDQVHRVLVLHTQLNQCCCYQHGSPACMFLFIWSGTVTCSKSEKYFWSVFFSYLPSPVTQWTPTHVSGSPLNSVLTRESHRSIISWVGADPSGKESSDTATPGFNLVKTARQFLSCVCIISLVVEWAQKNLAVKVFI